MLVLYLFTLKDNFWLSLGSVNLLGRLKTQANSKAFDDPASFNTALSYSTSIQAISILLTPNLTLSAPVNSSGTIHTTPDILLWTAALIRGTGAIMSISVVPTVPLDDVGNATLVLLAMKCAQINKMGIPVLLRYAPDMNGMLICRVL